MLFKINRNWPIYSQIKLMRCKKLNWWWVILFCWFNYVVHTVYTNKTGGIKISIWKFIKIIVSYESSSKSYSNVFGQLKNMESLEIFENSLENFSWFDLNLQLNVVYFNKRTLAMPPWHIVNLKINKSAIRSEPYWCDNVWNVTIRMEHDD